VVVIPAIVFGITAAAFLLFLGYQVWWQAGRGRKVEQLLPVDLEAFRNLTDAEETRYLRVSLSSKEFRRIQRLRLRAAASYISVISENAGRLVAIGRSVSANADAETTAAALDVVHRGLELKLRCSLWRLKLNATTLFPTLLSPSNRIADRYLDVSTMTASLPRKLAAPSPAA
jgi:hypothetical protein